MCNVLYIIVCNIRDDQGLMKISFREEEERKKKKKRKYFRHFSNDNSN